MVAEFLERGVDCMDNVVRGQPFIALVIAALTVIAVLISAYISGYRNRKKER